MYAHTAKHFLFKSNNDLRMSELPKLMSDLPKKFV